MDAVGFAALLCIMMGCAGSSGAAVPLGAPCPHPILHSLSAMGPTTFHAPIISSAAPVDPGSLLDLGLLESMSHSRCLWQLSQLYRPHSLLCVGPGLCWGSPALSLFGAITW